ncbi:MAG: hypothetical protein RLZZ546_107 [Bacteroidota bacterium]|jgi:hypothetical protein
MKTAFRQYLEDLEDMKVKPTSFYLALEEELTNIAYDDGFRDAIKKDNVYNNDYFNNTYLE